MFELALAFVGLVVAAGLVISKITPSRIWYVGNLAGNYVRITPNPGFQLGRFKWSQVYGRKR